MFLFIFGKKKSLILNFVEDLIHYIIIRYIKI